MVSDTGEPQGELTIEVQRGKYKDQSGVITYFPFVHASSRGFVDKTLCGSSLLGRVPDHRHPPQPLPSYPAPHSQPLTPKTFTQYQPFDFTLGLERGKEKAWVVG